MKLEMTRAWRGAAIALALTLLPTAAFGQGPPPPPRSVRATAEATVNATPDQARMNVAVVSQAATAEQAASENATKTDQVLAALRAALEQGAEVKTVGYTLSPNYVYPREGGEPKVTGYTATNTVLVKTGDLKKVGAVIDAAIRAGANQIQSLQFTLKDDTAVQAAALKEAARLARGRADAIASGLGVTVTGVLNAEEGGATVRPIMYDASSLRTAEAQTPIEPGMVEVRATVTLTVGIS